MLPFGVPVTAGRPFVRLKPYVARAILRTVAAGWAVALASADVHAGATEIAMTERLRDGMRQALNSGNLPGSRNMVVLPGTESRSRSEVLLPDGRTDIPILWIELFLQFGEHDPHAIVECKRIAGSDSSLCREYVVEGIDRFRSGKYAGNHAAGFMVGYLISGNACAAVEGINAYLNSTRGKHQPRREENLAPSSLISESWAWASRHPRMDALPIELHHGFLPMCEGNDLNE